MQKLKLKLPIKSHFGEWAKETPWPPLFCLGMLSCLCLVGWSSTMQVKLCIGKTRELSHSNASMAWVPWWLCRSIPHQSRWWFIIKELDMEGCTPISCLSGLATTFQFCEQLWWSSSLVSTGIYGLMSIPPLDAHELTGHSVQEDIHTCYTLLEIFTHPQWTLHSFPFIHPREVFLAWHWVITRPLSSFGVVLLSLPLGLGLTGEGLVHPSHTWQTPPHKGMPAYDVTRRCQLQCRTLGFPCWSFT